MAFLSRDKPQTHLIFAFCYGILCLKCRFSTFVAPTKTSARRLAPVLHTEFPLSRVDGRCQPVAAGAARSPGQPMSGRGALFPICPYAAFLAFIQLFYLSPLGRRSCFSRASVPTLPVLPSRYSDRHYRAEDQHGSVLCTAFLWKCRLFLPLAEAATA